MVASSTSSFLKPIIAVGSKNAAKIKAAKIVVNKLFPKARIISFDVSSDVSSQPLTDDETIKGAINRAKKAFRLSSADFAIGMEGGLHKIGNHWFECGWIAVIDKNGKIGLGSSGRYHLSNKLAKKVLAGKELGQIIDEMTGRKNVRSLEGAMGLFTNNHLPRYKAYSHGILFAFGPFISDPKFWD